MNMASEKELKLAYRLAIILLVVGILCYAAFPAGTPEQPARIMLKNMAGKVLFDHKGHTSVEGYGLSCVDCHHTDSGNDPHPEACGDCHKAESRKTEGQLVIKRFDAFHQQCESCHKDYDVGPEKEEDRCGWCHTM